MKEEKRYSSEAAIILAEVGNVRIKQPKVGGKKLYKMLKEKDIEMSKGRDALFDLLRDHDLLIKKKKRKAYTTDSYHHFYKHRNLIKELEIEKPEQVLVSDITYIDTMEGFCYLSLITDIYSRRIMGYYLSKSLSVEGCLSALRMAQKNLKNPKKVIHHSDRGIQYCCKKYIQQLERKGMLISMTEENHVYENALAERVNGILKDEFYLGEKIASYKVAKKLVTESIKTYNEERLHMSIGYLTPMMKHVE
jgi:transposase InsO family protein